MKKVDFFFFLWWWCTIRLVDLHDLSLTFAPKLQSKLSLSRSSSNPFSPPLTLSLYLSQKL